MIRPAVYPQRFMSSPTFALDYGEGELAVLPPHTKVVVTGNNRTRSVLVGLQGVVKKSVGLGGWHWLVIIFFLYKTAIVSRQSFLGLDFNNYFFSEIPRS